MRADEKEDASERAAEEEMARAWQRGWDEAAIHFQQQLLQQRQEMAHWQESTLNAIAAEHSTLHNQTQAAVVALAGSLVARLLHEFAPSAEGIARLAGEALAEVVPGTAEVQLSLAPADFAKASGLMREYGHSYPGLRVAEDTTLQPGDCRVQSCFGTVDGRLQTKLANLLTALS